MIRLIVIAIAAVSTACALAVWLLGGVRFSVGPAIISSSDPVRPLALAVVAALIYVWMSGSERIRADVDRARPYAAISLAALLSLCAAAAGVARNSWTAAGSDSYAYVAQADLWLDGTQSVPAPVAAELPWPEPLWTLAPYGFKPAANRAAIVPITPPGLSLLMAAAKMTAGHCAMFWVVPIAGGLLVWTTFLLGRRLGSEAVGIAAAWLMATSPAFLAMLVSPMSDVPATLFWAAAIFFILESSRVSAVKSGFATSVAILIRPNLAPLALLLFAFRRSWMFAAATIPGCLLVAGFNWSVYGSPVASGYGDLSSLFSMRNVAVNFGRYGTWLIQSQTPLMLGGVLSLSILARQTWTTREGTHRAWMLGAFIAAVWVLYLAYVPFDAWWYLRFLLPAWPALCVGAAMFWLRVPAMLRIRHDAMGIAMLVVGGVIGFIGVHGVRFASANGAFPTGEGDHRYATIGKIVEQLTEPTSVILTGQNAGGTRYYGGRLTLRFEALDPAWLDRGVAWMSDRGRHPYFLLEEWELPIFQERFSASNKLGALPLTPVAAYQSRGVPGQVYLFDPSRPDGPTRRVLPPATAAPKCVEPAPAVMLNWR